MSLAVDSAVLSRLFLPRLVSCSSHLESFKSFTFSFKRFRSRSPSACSPLASNTHALGAVLKRQARPCTRNVAALPQRETSVAVQGPARVEPATTNTLGWELGATRRIKGRAGPLHTGTTDDNDPSWLNWLCRAQRRRHWGAQATRIFGAPHSEILSEGAMAHCKRHRTSASAECRLPVPLPGSMASPSCVLRVQNGATDQFSAPGPARREGRGRGTSHRGTQGRAASIVGPSRRACCTVPDSPC
jgi:hypothetical protein